MSLPPYNSDLHRAFEKITNQMVSREATERVLREVILGYLSWKAEVDVMIGPGYIKGNPLEYWIINVYQPPKPNRTDPEHTVPQ